jgi:hypothetical protein
LPLSAQSKAEANPVSSGAGGFIAASKVTQVAQLQPLPVSETTAPLAVRSAASTSTTLVGTPAQAAAPAPSMHQSYQYGSSTGFNPYRASLMDPNYSTLYSRQPPPQFPAHIRLASASAPPPQATQHSRPTLPPPVPSAPVVPQACKQPALLAPFIDARPDTPPQGLLTGTSAAPSWVHTPPRVPQLFTPPATGKPATSVATTNGLMPSLRSDLQGPMTGLATTLTGAQYSAGYPSSTRVSMTERGPMLAPINSSSSTQHTQQQLKHAAIPSLNMLSRPNGMVSARRTSDAQSVGHPMAAARINSQSSPSQDSSTSPESAASPPALNGSVHGRPIRKKQKTAKAKATA